MPQIPLPLVQPPLPSEVRHYHDLGFESHFKIDVTSRALVRGLTSQDYPLVRFDSSRLPNVLRSCHFKRAEDTSA